MRLDVAFAAMRYVASDVAPTSVRKSCRTLIQAASCVLHVQGPACNRQDLRQRWPPRHRARRRGIPGQRRG